MKYNYNSVYLGWALQKYPKVWLPSAWVTRGLVITMRVGFKKSIFNLSLFSLRYLSSKPPRSRALGLRERKAAILRAMADVTSRCGEGSILPCQICQLIGDDEGNVGEVVREATFELDVGWSDPWHPPLWFKTSRCCNDTKQQARKANTCMSCL